MAYWCEKYWERNQKCDLRRRLQKSCGDVVDAVFERRMPSNLMHTETVDAVNCLKEICAKCKGQR